MQQRSHKLICSSCCREFSTENFDTNIAIFRKLDLLPFLRKRQYRRPTGTLPTSYRRPTVALPTSYRRPTDLPYPFYDRIRYSVFGVFCILSQMTLRIRCGHVCHVTPSGHSGSTNSPKIWSRVHNCQFLSRNVKH